MIRTMLKTVREVLKLKTFEERYEYLRLTGVVGESTFGFDRYINQMLYGSQAWSDARDSVIIRDNGCDLGVEGYEIKGRINIHHINPINIDDVMSNSDKVFNLDFLICTSHNTHLAIHYGDKSLLPVLPIKRYPGDTCPWR